MYPALYHVPVASRYYICYGGCGLVWLAALLSFVVWFKRFQGGAFHTTVFCLLDLLSNVLYVPLFGTRFLLYYIGAMMEASRCETQSGRYVSSLDNEIGCNQEPHLILGLCSVLTAAVLSLYVAFYKKCVFPQGILPESPMAALSSNHELAFHVARTSLVVIMVHLYPVRSAPSKK